MSTTVNRDPFARGDYKRFILGNRSLTYTPQACDWCGQTPPRLYSYVWWADDKPEPEEDSGYWFCNADCFHDYFDE
jgi:hypothetical protein